MRVTVDTNVLVRAALADDPIQGPLAAKLLREAESIAVSVHSLCEYCWVLRRTYKLPRAIIVGSIRKLAAAPNVVVDRGALSSGLEMLDAGGDFADAVIAREGRLLGGPVFATFDREAADFLAAAGHQVAVVGAG